MGKRIKTRMLVPKKVIEPPKSTFEHTWSSQRIMIDKPATGEKFPITIVRSKVKITTEWNDVVVFEKCNRATLFVDSRERKGIPECEVRSELNRLLPSKEAARAYFLLICPV